MALQRNLINKLDPQRVEEINQMYLPETTEDLEIAQNVPEKILQVLIELRTHFNPVCLIKWSQNGDKLLGVYRIGSCNPTGDLLGRDYIVYIFESWEARAYQKDEPRLFPPYTNLGNQLLCGLSGPTKVKHIWQIKPERGLFNYVTGRYHENAEIIDDDLLNHLFFDFNQMVFLTKFLFPKFIKS